MHFISLHLISFSFYVHWVVSTQIWVKYGQTQMLG